jgi:hypothetical protein
MLKIKHYICLNLYEGHGTRTQLPNIGHIKSWQAMSTCLIVSDVSLADKGLNINVNKLNLPRYEVLTAVLMKIQVFWDMTLLTSKQLPSDVLEKHSASIFRVKYPKK